MRRQELQASRRIRLALAIVGNVVPVGIATATRWSTHHTVFLVGAIGACLVPVLVTILPERTWAARRLAAYTGLPLLTLLQAYSGGVASPYAVVLMMAVVWFGLSGSIRDLLGMVVLLSLCCTIPMLTIGSPAYPVSWGIAALVVFIGVTIASVLCFATRETATLAQRLRDEAVTDPLTGLLNRRGWQKAGEAELERSRRTGSPVALIAFDLDDLKQINDADGHAAGDCALRNLAEQLRGRVRAGDICARLGGDEFIALLVPGDADAARRVVASMRERAHVPAFSVGIAVRGAEDTLELLTARADAALYAAKSAGAELSDVRRGALAT